MLSFYQYEIHKPSQILHTGPSDETEVGGSLRENGGRLHTLRLSLMFSLVSAVRQSRARGGGPEALRGPEDGETGDQSEDRRGSPSSLKPR